MWSSFNVMFIKGSVLCPHCVGWEGGLVYEGVLDARYFSISVDLMEPFVSTSVARSASSSGRLLGLD